VPHVVSSVPSTQRKPAAPFDSQQPVGQFCAVHVVVGVSQACEAGSHCWKPSCEQFAHATPPVPQTPSWLPGWQLPLPSQQPLGHVPPLQLLGGGALQVCVVTEQDEPAAQAAHAVPLAPQAAGRFPGWHAPLESQQPFGQLLTLQAVASNGGTTIIPLSGGYP
jgi:hypothetical protein